MYQVIEWDTSLHKPGTDLWTKGVLADGGNHCRKLCQLVDEPLIKGMIVGTEKDFLSIEEREEVCIHPRQYSTPPVGPVILTDGTVRAPKMGLPVGLSRAMALQRRRRPAPPSPVVGWIRAQGLGQEQAMVGVFGAV